MSPSTLKEHGFSPERVLPRSSKDRTHESPGTVGGQLSTPPFLLLVLRYHHILVHLVYVMMVKYINHQVDMRLDDTLYLAQKLLKWAPHMVILTESISLTGMAQCCSRHTVIAGEGQDMVS